MTNPTASEVREMRDITFHPTDRHYGLVTSVIDLLSAMEKAEPVGDLRLQLDRWDIIGIHSAILKLKVSSGNYPVYIHPHIPTAQAGRPAADGDLVKYHPAPNAASPMVPSSPTHNLQVSGSKMRDEIAAIIRLADGESVAQGYVTKVGSGYTKPNLPVGSWENRALLAEELCRAYKIQIDLLVTQSRTVPAAMEQQVFRNDDPERFGFVRGWNACLETTIAVSQDAEGGGHE